MSTFNNNFAGAGYPYGQYSSQYQGQYGQYPSQYQQYQQYPSQYDQYSQYPGQKPYGQGQYLKGHPTMV